MERNFNNKVYINPNFKGIPLIKSLSTNCSRKTYVNRHYTKILNQNYVQQTIPGKRKIYVNPNFIQTGNIQPSSTACSISSLGGYQNNEDVIDNFKHKYSSERNVTSNRTQIQSNKTINSDKSFNTEITNKQTTDSNFNISPLSRSRYSIIRKKQVTDNKVEDNIKSSSNTQTMNIIEPSLVGWSDSIQKSNKYINQPSEKVVKIKISKYKTVPITYLDKKYESNRVKPKSMLTATKFEKHGKLLKTNQYKYIKVNRVSLTNNVIVNSKPHVNTNVNNNKSTLHNLVKTKVIKAKFRINNIPCRLFTKYGKCLRQMYGNCQYLHDKKHVSLCRKFLKGICHDNNCSLSHELTAKKMPTCYFYLKGMCTKDNCPYVHIKMSKNIKICQDFLRGYCEKGEACIFRHETSELNLKNNHSKRKRQLIKKEAVMKHVKISKKSKKKEIFSVQKDILLHTDRSDVDHRYYKELVTDENICQIKPTRCKLGILPSFIQL